jgi:hypothetical protein
VHASGAVRGGHEYEVVGYDRGRDLWEFVNSWGDGWGQAGHFFMSTADYVKLLAADGDATVLVPISQPAPTPVPVPAPTPEPAPVPPIAGLPAAAREPLPDRGGHAVAEVPDLQPEGSERPQRHP